MAKPTQVPTKSSMAQREANRGNFPSMKRLLGEESGQVLPWVVVVMMVVLGMAALSVDLGRAMVVRRQLQTQVDAAALAAAERLPNTDYSSYGNNYSGQTGQKNVAAGVTVNTPVITPICSTTVSGWGIVCSSTNPNAVQVTETATISTLFAQLLGKNSLTVSATSTASKGRPEPYNVAVILDTTPSMTTTDSSCSSKTQLECAVEGVQSLLKGLEPSMDNVSLFTFPNMDVNDVSNEYNCAGSYNQSVPPYTFPYSDATTLTTMPYYYETTSTRNGKTVTTPHTENVTYQIVDYSNDYKSSDTATTLSTSSNLVKAVGGKSGCSSMGTGYENTYFAGAVYAAQASLVAEQKAYPSYLNAMILLSDGDATAKVSNANGDYSPGSNEMISNKTESNSTNWATSGGSYGSWVGECSQAVDAAKAASTAGTVVYTIAYGSPTTSSTANCASDRNSAASHYKITPCQTLQQMSTNYNSGDTSHFFSDTAFGSDKGCLASGNNSGVSAISQIYSLIASQLSGARLIPNGTP